MKTISFKRLQVPLDLKGHKIAEQDVRHELGNFIYQTQSTIEMRRLAEKIYDSEDECELSDDEVQMLLQSGGGMTLAVKDAINNALK